jgi:signal transduction histidine kinase
MENAETMSSAEACAAHLALTRRIMAVAGHDLKQPLQIALMSIDVALGEGVSPVIENQLKTARGALKRLTHELDDLARTSQADDRLAPRLQATQLRTLFDEIDGDWKTYSENCGVMISFETPDVHVETDPAMLKTVLRNLIGNAVKYSNPGSEVWVTARCRTSHVIIEVADEGCGIADGALTRIFDAFERGGRTDVGGGLGLGLHIVRETARLLNHPVAVQSIEGEGSRFSVALRRAPDDATAARH